MQETEKGGGGMGGGGTLGRSKGKMMSSGPGGPNPKGQSKGAPKVNGNNSSGQGGWWPECTCSNREWYDQVMPLPLMERLPHSAPRSSVGRQQAGSSWTRVLLDWGIDMQLGMCLGEPVLMIRASVVLAESSHDETGWIWSLPWS